MQTYTGVINRYREYLPVSKKTPIITLREGNTPLIPVPKLAQKLGIPSADLYVKFEGLNPTGSFKDRGMTLAISKAVEQKSPAVICASTGNTSASAAAYAAYAGLACIVLIPQGAIALGKLSQAMIHGANVCAIKGNFDDALRLVRTIADEHSVTLVNSLNPFRIEGQKTGAFEIIDTLGDAPDFHIMPVGNAGNITAYWKGYKEYHDRQKSTRLPVMMGFQAAGAAPIVHNKQIKKPETIATAIRIGNPASWHQAVQARDESKGIIDMVSDDEIIRAYQLLARTSGIFCEPASAASIAGLSKYIQQGYFANHIVKASRSPVRVVCILTGHGLKDPECTIASVGKPKIIENDLSVVRKEIGL
ncbi:MAG: threonine synthase [Elusimicrobia bacterium]|nr:threonine synthase [Elusimicrobiota bacterium]MBD3412021.1 threonine synthase [Elusimicrobiota bacterium]